MNGPISVFIRVLLAVLRASGAGRMLRYYISKSLEPENVAFAGLFSASFVGALTLIGGTVYVLVVGASLLFRVALAVMALALGGFFVAIPFFADDSNS